MIEVLVTLLILVVGLIGILGLQARGQQAELESYQRGQALILLQDMVDRINANRADAQALAYATSVVGAGSALVDCSGKTGAARDICEWTNLLDGAAEFLGASTSCSPSSGANCVGAMLGARGCIAYDAASELTNSSGAAQAGTGIYTVSVAWQGLAPSVAPPSSLTCGQNLYPSESRRRVVTSTLRIAALKAS